MGGIRQIGPVRYLAVNVYEGSGGWRVAVMVREPGRPYPRLISQVADIPLRTDRGNLSGALEAASEALARLSGELAPPPSA